MSNEISTVKFGNYTIDELKKKVEDNTKIDDFQNGCYETIFGEGGLTLQEQSDGTKGVTYDAFSDKLAGFDGFSQDMIDAYWEILNKNSDDDIIDENEYNDILNSFYGDTVYSSDGSTPQNIEAGQVVTARSLYSKLKEDTVEKYISGTSTAEETSTSTTTTDSATSTDTAADATVAASSTTTGAPTAEELSTDLDNLEKDVSDAEAAEAKKTDSTTETNKIGLAELFAKNSKVQQDEDGTYYITSETWGSGSTDALDCTSKIVKNVYGVNYSSAEGQAITQALIEANPEFFKNGVNTIPSNARLNLIDATEILGLATEEVEKTEEVPAEEVPAEGAADEAAAQTEAKDGSVVVNADGTTTYQGTDDDGNIVYTTKNEDGVITSKKTMNQDGTVEKEQLYTYNADGTQNKVTTLDKNGNIESISTYSYENGQRTCEKKYYDENMNVVSVENYDANGDLIKTEDPQAATEKETTDADETSQEAQNTESETAATEAELRNELASVRAQTLYAAMDRWGTDEDAVKKILENVEGQALVDVMNAYEEKYGESLKEAIEDDFSSKTEKDLTDKLHDAEQEVKHAEKYGQEVVLEEVNEETILSAKMDAINAACDRHGTTENVLNSIILNSTDEELSQLIKYYDSNNEEGSFKSRVLGEVSGQQDKILRQKIEAAENYTPQEETAEQETQLRTSMADARALALHAAMDRAGTDEDAVKKILENVEGQALVDVMNAYEEKYGESLKEAIEDDFSSKTEKDLTDKLHDAEQEVKHAEKYGQEVVLEEVNEQAVIDAYADAFLEATNARKGTDESVVYSILNSGLSDDQIVSLANTLSARGENIVSIIKSEFSGNTEEGLINRLKELGIE